MQFHEEYLTILSVEQSPNDLTLRLDTSDWLKAKNKNSVIQLNLINCHNVQESFEELKKYIGELVWTYEFSDEHVLRFWLDDGSEIGIKCVNIIEKKSDIELDELFLKYQWLSENYQRESKHSSKGWGKYQRLNELLKTETKSEIQNLKKKKNFFRERETGNSDKFETAIKICERILNFIEQVEKE